MSKEQLRKYVKLNCTEMIEQKAPIVTTAPTVDFPTSTHESNIHVYNYINNESYVCSIITSV